MDDIMSCLLPVSIIIFIFYPLTHTWTEPSLLYRRRAGSKYSSSEVNCSSNQLSDATALIFLDIFWFFLFVLCLLDSLRWPCSVERQMRARFSIFPHFLYVSARLLRNCSLCDHRCPHAHLKQFFFASSSLPLVEPRRFDTMESSFVPFRGINLVFCSVLSVVLAISW